MAQDPDKVYLPDGSEAKKVDRNKAYKDSRERFLAQRQKYKDTPMPTKPDRPTPSGPKPKAPKPVDRAPKGTQAGHAVTSVNRKTGMPN